MPLFPNQWAEFGRHCSFMRDLAVMATLTVISILLGGSSLTEIASHYFVSSLRVGFTLEPIKVMVLVMHYVTICYASADALYIRQFIDGSPHGPRLSATK